MSAHVACAAGPQGRVQTAAEMEHQAVCAEGQRSHAEAGPV